MPELNINDAALAELKSHYDNRGKLVWLTGGRDTGKTFLCKKFAAAVGDACYVDYRNTGNADECCDLLMKVAKLALNHSLIILDHYYNQMLTSSLFRAIQELVINRKVMLVVVTRQMLFSAKIFIPSEFDTVIRLENPGMECCSRILSGYSAKENVMNYALHGGMPAVMSLLTGGKSVRENIIGLLKVRDSWVDYVLQGIASDEKKMAEKILCALARGGESVKELSDMIQVPSDEITGVIYLLEAEGLVRRMEGFDFSLCKILRLERWELANQSLCFLFRFAYGFCSDADADKYYETQIEPYFTRFVEESWPRFCYYGSDKYRMIYGRRKEGGKTLKVNIKVPERFGTERFFPLNLTFCDFCLDADDEAVDSRLGELMEKSESFYTPKVMIGFEVDMPSSSRMVMA